MPLQTELVELEERFVVVYPDVCAEALGSSLRALAIERGVGEQNAELRRQERFLGDDGCFHKNLSDHPPFTGDYKKHGGRVGERAESVQMHQ